MKTLTVTYGFKNRTDSFYSQFDLNHPTECYETVLKEVKSLNWNVEQPDLQMSDKVAINTAKHKGTFKVVSVELLKKGMFNKFQFTLNL